MTSALVHVPLEGEPRVDSRLMADALNNLHKPLMNLIQKHLAKFLEFGVLSFEKTKPSAKGGRPERYALLNENQSYLLLTMARNTRHAVDLKTRLIHEFAAARAGAGRMTRSFTARRLALERADLRSKEQASAGARLMCARRRELPGFRAAREALEHEMQRTLFGPPSPT